MKRAHDIKAAGHWDEAKAVDAVALDAHDRHRRRVMLSGERGTKFLLDLPQATALRDGDGLVLEDGAIIRVSERSRPGAAGLAYRQSSLRRANRRRAAAHPARSRHRRYAARARREADAGRSAV